MYIAGIVLFNPDIERLRENIGAIADQVDSVVCVDNHSENIEQIKSLLSEYPNVFLELNEENLGIAKALNQVLEYARKKGANWALTLDQDSVADKHLISVYEKYTEMKNVGMLTPIIKDRNSSMLVEFDEEYVEVQECITSGCLTNVGAMQEIGNFDEKMFIDLVDFDACHSLREHGYRVVRVNYCGLLHEVGKTRVVRFFGKNEEIYNHSPFRKYYIIRNRVYFIKKHKHSVNTKKEYCRLVKYCLLVILYERGKLEKVKAMCKGIRDGIKMIK